MIPEHSVFRKAKKDHTNMETTSKSVHLEWVGSRMVVGTDHKGHTISIGYQREKEPEWQGANPSDLLLLSAASCSTYDVVAILEKQKQPLEGLTVTVTARQNAEVPYNYLSMHITYHIRGDVDPDKVERAIHLSEEKYCSVTNTLRPSMEITSDYDITP